jgi:hypothetical protein
VADSETDASRRGEILEMLAGFGDRRPDQVSERIDSMELTWLIHQIEQRYGTDLDLDDSTLARMSTVSGAAGLLAELRLEARTAPARPDAAATAAGTSADD